MRVLIGQLHSTLLLFKYNDLRLTVGRNIPLFCNIYVNCLFKKLTDFIPSGQNINYGRTQRLYRSHFKCNAFQSGLNHKDYFVP